jgi:quinol monooxygenase YgiN
LFEEEPDTLAWYAVELPGTDKFILFDIFTDEAAFKLHMEGKIAAHLISVAKEFFAGPMDLVKFEVVAASVKV